MPEIEHYIQTVKDRVRSTYPMLPFRRIPRIMVVHLVKNSVFWVNSFPHQDGVSNQHPPRFIMTGLELKYKLHVCLHFGSYVQTHEPHNNSMNSCTLGAICLGPNGNQQGGHFFLNHTTGEWLTRHAWTEMPMPTLVADRVNELGRQQAMPMTLTFGD